ncbi:MAG: hypothetical protein JO080_00840 [Mucilaginibacter sp.]|nr:hypothetical protein [Mucilaginibacter sp.]
MKKQLHIDLLEKLRDAGIGMTMDISPFMVKHFKKPANMNINPHKGMRPAILFIEDLLKRNFIRSDEGFDLSNYFEVIQNPANNFVKWFDDVDVSVYLTSNGLDYLDSYYLQQSYFSLNGASERNFKSQKWFSRGTIGLAVVTAVMTIFTFIDTNADSAKMDRMQKSIDSLKQESKTLKSLTRSFSMPSTTNSHKH